MVAEREGLFKREGLDFRVVIPQPGGADRMIAALHDDTVDVTHVATPFLVRAALAGSDAVAIAAEFNNPIYSLVARPEIGRIADLKGRLVGMADPGGQHRATRCAGSWPCTACATADVKMKIIDGTPARLTCLRRGECAAVPLGQPQDLRRAERRLPRARALDRGGARVRLHGHRGAPLVGGGEPGHRGALRAGARRRRSDSYAIPRTARPWCRRSSRRPAFPPAIAERTLALYFEPDRRVLPRQGEIDIAGLAQVIAFMEEAGQLKAPLPAPERFVDLQYLQAAGVR